ncbi:hypothetical protein [Paracnuella aquatica]|uniref:hypothetical protein n=1 Tax=Paracnuella aquatica TaxID=2268757 RepID=UPI000DEEBD8B|nr:hypothetical protein [Paracnuella aquatica]RPD44041.1 hypothetical protein DRJ53_18305 [Paracnuella aquatica]
MPVILNKWDELISNTLNPTNINLIPLTDEVIRGFIYQSEAEREKVRGLLMEGMINRPKIRDKQQYVQVNQALLIRLLDRVYSYKQVEGLDEKIIHLYNTISAHLEATLNFIEDFFSNYFDRNEKAPASYFLTSIDELCRKLELLKVALEGSTTIDPQLGTILTGNFERFCFGKRTGATYNELYYQRSLMNELLTEDTLSAETSVRQVLFSLNFNDDSYIAYLIEKLTALTEQLDTRREKVAALRFEQKNINQSRTKLNTILNSNMPSIKEQVNQWIDEEIKFLEADTTPETTPKTETEQEDKIQTALSVAKLALLLRLMIIDKMIVNRVVAQVLRITVKTVTTLQKENIAFGSLETKYHNPDRGTISAVKDMLFRWINILNKL